MIKMYSLTTCPWCKKMKAFLREEGLEFDVMEVDVAEESVREKTLEEISAMGATGAFPVTVINGQAVVGYDPDRVRELVNDLDE